MLCNSAYRSSLAAGIMKKMGFKDVRNLEGGSQAWIDAGFPTYGSDSAKKATTPGAYVNLPEHMSPEDLAKRLMDLPGTIDVLDIRPAWQFTEYHIPGSINVSVPELMGNPVYLSDRRPLVIVCRDGSLSAAVGGALIQKSPRPIRFLSGGVMRYYDEIMRPRGIISDRMTTGAPSGPALPSQKQDIKPEKVPEKSGPVPIPQGSGPKKKRAGC
jgi:rhodanese-related sulfurtransferase